MPRNPTSIIRAYHGELIRGESAGRHDLALVDADRDWRQAIGLVLDIGCQVLEFGQVLTAVVRTEQQFAT
jgi:hypothetical protein